MSEGFRLDVKKMQTKQECLMGIPFEYILGFSKETGLIRRKECFTKKDFVHRLLRTMSLSDCYNLNAYYKNGISYEKAVDDYLGRYPTAGLISKHFVEHLRVTNADIGTICFEFPVIKTRVDILRLEQSTFAYEVKSQRDKLDRLTYQLPALQEIFDYTLLIIPFELENKIEHMVHDNVGIITYRSENGRIIFDKYREAEIANYGDKRRQLDILRLDELIPIYRETCGRTPSDRTRKNLIDQLCSKLDSSQINDLFKSTLRKRERFSMKKTYVQKILQER